MCLNHRNRGPTFNINYVELAGPLTGRGFFTGLLDTLEASLPVADVMRAIAVQNVFNQRFVDKLSLRPGWSFDDDVNTMYVLFDKLS